MKTPASLLALALAAVPASAGIRLPRNVFDIPSAGAGFEGYPRPAADPRFVPADYVVRPVQGRATASNLTQPRIDRLQRIVQGNDPRPRAASPLPQALHDRVVFAINELDQHSPPLTGAQWDQKIADFSRQYQALFPVGVARAAAAWSDGVDRLNDSLMTLADDPHTEYYDQVEYQNLLSSLRNEGTVGIGAHVEASPEGLRVVRVPSGSPAARAGLRRDDVITHADGAPLAGLSLSDAVGLLRGAEGSIVRLRLQRGGSELSIARATVQTPNHFSRLIPGTDIGYIYFSGFEDGIAETIVGRRARPGAPRTGGLIEALWRQGARQLILDVRSNPGGLVTEVQLLASEFLRDGSVINYMHGTSDSERAVTRGDGRYASGLPLAILVNGGSASASEILSSALKEWRRAVVIGSRTYGKGCFQGILQGPDGTGVRVTNGLWNTPRDRNISGLFDPSTGRNAPGTGGVVPDIAVEVAPEVESTVMEGIVDQLVRTGGPAAVDPALAAAFRAAWPATSGPAATR